MADVLKITKEGLVVTMITDRKPITYNMGTHQFTSYTGREVQSFPRNVNLTAGLSHIELMLFNATVNANQWQCDYLHRLEMWLGQPELLANVPTDRMYNLAEICPKGFVKWLKEKNYSPVGERLREFLMEQAEKNLTKEDRELIALLSDETRTGAPFAYDAYNFKSTFGSWNDKKRISFRQMLKSSVKKLNFCLRDDIRNFFRYATRQSLFSGIPCPDNWEEYVDTNRDFAYNIEILQTICHKTIEPDMIKTEDIGREITNLSNDQFVIIVPSKLEDFIDEGKQQHNCVGSHYNKKVAEGEDFIYFIRKADSPEKSYITNRYNKYWEKTTETRKTCNAVNDDEDAKLLIMAIDRELRRLFNKRA